MSKFTEIIVGTIVELFLAALALGLLYRVWGSLLPVPRMHNIIAFQRGVVVCEGQVEKVLGPGRHWVTPRRTLMLCDVRPAPFQVSAQELLTADGMAVRMSLGGEYRVVNPALFVTESSDSFGAFFLEVRRALRNAVGELESQNFFAGQALIPARMKELLIPKAAQLGLEMTQLEVGEAVPVGWLRQV